ncbi:hypothetical protein [Melittangium boletus]|uniref:hypothetical protein n=1 Tax=Melittangium boletus TaxID=83453 RepID=UPI003DA5103B
MTSQVIGFFFAALLAGCGVDQSANEGQNNTSAPTESKDRDDSEASGQYEWICVSTSGSSYSMAKGANLTSCKGSYLQKYINGRFIKAYPLTASGTIAHKVPPNADCIIALGTTAIGIVTSADVVSWVVTVAGFYGLHSCVA